MMSVVCTYNNKKTLAGCLLRSLKAQTAKHERFMIDNTKGKFKSAAEALNYGGRKATGKYIMFVHQDVDLSSRRMLEKIEKNLDSLPNLGIAGVAGNSGEIRRIATNIRHGCPPRAVGRIRVKGPIKVQTLDECLVLIPRSVFKTLEFDERACNDWHLYAVDYALSAKKRGFDAYVLPALIHHLSAGALTEKFYLTLQMLFEKHRGTGLIYATTGFWNTRIPIRLQKMRCFQLFVIGTSILFNDGPVVFLEDAHSFLFR